jgi:hypothetical protein
VESAFAARYERAAEGGRRKAKWEGEIRRAEMGSFQHDLHLEMWHRPQQISRSEKIISYSSAFICAHQRSLRALREKRIERSETVTSGKAKFEGRKWVRFDTIFIWKCGIGLNKFRAAKKIISYSSAFISVHQRSSAFFARAKTYRAAKKSYHTHQRSSALICVPCELCEKKPYAIIICCIFVFKLIPPGAGEPTSYFKQHLSDGILACKIRTF